MPVDRLRLDLTDGPLDHGTRALWGMLRPDEPQPLTAPGWTSSAAMWRLDGDARGFASWGMARDDFPRRVPAISETSDPRRALALALEAMCARS